MDFWTRFILYHLKDVSSAFENISVCQSPTKVKELLTYLNYLHVCH